MFDLDFFRERPEAFYLLARELWPDNYYPTPVHYFIRLLHDKGMLLRCFTQNIDSLEAATGLPREKIVAAHGNFDSAHCIDTGEAVDIEQLRTAIQAGKEGPGGWLELAELHGGLVKPDIVFFGEQASLARPACPPTVPAHRARPSSAPPARPLTLSLVVGCARSCRSASSGWRRRTSRSATCSS